MSHHNQSFDTVQNSTELNNSSKKKLNKYFLFTLGLGLVISALISIAAVLFGKFDTNLTRALSTTASMVAHTLVGLAIVSVDMRKTSNRSKLLFNSILLITIASFITSVLGIWEILKGQLIWDLYTLYLYTILSILWIELLLKIGSRYAEERSTRVTSQIGVGFTVLFYFLLIPTIFINYPDIVPEYIFRALAATAIALATISVLTTVLHRIFLFKNPNIKSKVDKNAPLDIILAVVILCYGLPVIFFLVTTVITYQSRNSAESTQYSNKSSGPENSSSPSVANGERLNCTALPGFNKDLAEELGYVFIDDNTTSKTLVLSYYDGRSSTQREVQYQKEIFAVDKNCVKIDINTMKYGDDVAVYLRDHNDYKSLEFIQKTY